MMWARRVETAVLALVWVLFAIACFSGKLYNSELLSTTMGWMFTIAAGVRLSKL